MPTSASKKRRGEDKDKENVMNFQFAEASLEPLPIRCHFGAESASSSSRNVVAPSASQSPDDDRSVLAGLGIVVCKTSDGSTTVIGLLSDGSAAKTNKVLIGDECLALNGAKIQSMNAKMVKLFVSRSNLTTFQLRKLITATKGATLTLKRGSEVVFVSYTQAELMDPTEINSGFFFPRVSFLFS